MEVLSFTTENVTITANTAADMANCWRRFRSRVGKHADTYCDYHSTLRGSLKLAKAPDFTLSNVGEPDSCDWNGLPPVFYETAIYNVSIYLTDIDEAPCVMHKLKEVTELFTIIQIGGKGSKEWLMSAPLSFVNEPGIFHLTFRYKPCGKAHRTDTLSFRVVSPKLDTKSDYIHVLADINEQYNEIVFQYLTLTLQNLQRGGRSDNDVVWLSIFRSIARDYEKWVRYIVNRPHLRQTREMRYDRADRIKYWTPRMEETYAEVEQNGRLDRDYFRHEETLHTYNTRENRFVKFTLDRIASRLGSIVALLRAKDARAKASDKIAPAELDELDSYAASIRRLANAKLFRKLRGEPLRSDSIVLQKRTGYAQVYKYWLLLQKGIDLFEGANAIGVRPIWELYELWCFLKMRRMLADLLHLSFDNPSEIEETPMPMLKPFEENGQQHTIVYKCADGSKVILYYQHTFNRHSGRVHTATTENRPDIVLNIVKSGDFVLTYLFDAKYRLIDDNKLNDDDLREHSEIDGIDYPPSDAINQMHRYRDAIYYGTENRAYSAKEIIGGYILYPGRIKGPLKKKPYFLESIDTVNIGAFPLLPDSGNPDSEGTLLLEFLSGILNTPRAYDNVKDSIPQKGLQYESAFEPTEEDLVLVGYYKTEQWEPMERNRLYYVPTAFGNGSIHLVSGFEKTKYLLLHHGERRLLVRLTGDGPKFYPKAALEKKGFAPTSGEYFLGFDIKSFKPVPGIDPYTFEIERRGKLTSAPYFTTLRKLLST